MPFIIWMPETFQKGVTSDQLVNGMDVFPTILDLLNIELPGDRTIDGISVLPFLEGESEESGRNGLFLMTGKNVNAVISGNYKYFANDKSDMGAYYSTSQGPFLFDIKKDPSESYDVTAHYPYIAAKLEKELEEFRSDMENNQRGWIE